MEIFAGILNNPITLTILGFIMARFPRVRGVIANRLIPFIQTAIAWVASVVAPGPAAAAEGPLGLHGPIVAIIGFNFFGLVGPIFGGLGSALWQATQAHLLHRMFIRKLVGADPSDSRQ